MLLKILNTEKVLNEILEKERKCTFFPIEMNFILALHQKSFVKTQAIF